MKKLSPTTRLKEMRVAKGLGQKDLGEKVGASHSTIGGIERQELPASLHLATELARAFGVSIDKIFRPHDKLRGRFLAK